jgi:chitosanase
MRYSASLIILTTGMAAGRQIPQNVKSFYDTWKVYRSVLGFANILTYGQGKSCSNPLSPAYDVGVDQKSRNSVYCMNKTSNVVFVKNQNGGFADMDIDCDGAGKGQGGCSDDPTGLGETSFKDQVQSLTNGAVSDLDTNKHTFVVLSNFVSNDASGDNRKPFDIQSVGVNPLSIVAIVCGGQMFYGVYGDRNGGVVTGEASLSLGKLCFPNEGLSGNMGHGATDVLYLAFPGAKAPSGASWTAKDAKTFEASLAAEGDKLVARIGKTS